MNIDVMQAFADNRIAPIKFAKQTFLLDGRGVLFWPSERLLVFSDLHFEKASYLRTHANPIPNVDTFDTLNRMQHLIAQYLPDKVICLGDSFHDIDAFNRISQQYLDTLLTLSESVNEWVWVLGNHDPSLPAFIHGTQLKTVTINSILFTHEPYLISDFPQVIGHFHPKARSRNNAHTLSGKCFIASSEKLLMPAFGSYTGGLDIEHEAIIEHVPRTDRKIFLMCQRKIYVV